MVPYQVKNILYIYPFWVLTTHPYLHLNLGLAYRGCKCVTILLNHYGFNYAIAIKSSFMTNYKRFKVLCAKRVYLMSRYLAKVYILRSSEYLYAVGVIDKVYLSKSRREPLFIHI